MPPCVPLKRKAIEMPSIEGWHRHLNALESQGREQRWRRFGGNLSSEDSKMHVIEYSKALHNLSAHKRFKTTCFAASD